MKGADVFIGALSAHSLAFQDRASAERSEVCSPPLTFGGGASMRAVLDQILDGPLIMGADHSKQINSKWQQLQRLVENGYHLDELLGPLR